MHIYINFLDIPYNLCNDFYPTGNLVTWAKLFLHFLEKNKCTKIKTRMDFENKYFNK